MSKLILLRDAIEKLDQAEDALLYACRAFRFTTIEYRRLYAQYENAGDAKEIISALLEQEESVLFAAAHIQQVLDDQKIGG